MLRTKERKKERERERERERRELINDKSEIQYFLKTIIMKSITSAALR